MSATQPANDYVYGDCTWYVKSLYPQLANDLGNAQDWIANAQNYGYTVLTQPVAGTIVVYGGSEQGDTAYSQYGHVAVVQSVNGDGTFNVSEMNYNGWNVTDNRVSTMTDVLGFIVPPGGAVTGSAAATSNVAATTATASTVTASAGSTCQLYQLKLPGLFPGQSGWSICFDKPAAALFVTMGLGLIFAGAAALMVTMLKGSKTANQALDIAALATGPIGKAAAASARATQSAQAEQRERKATSERESRQTASSARAEADAAHRTRMQRAQLRRARASARSAESRARSGGHPRNEDVAASARRKARGGRFSDFTPAEAAYAQSVGGKDLLSD